MCAHTQTAHQQNAYGTELVVQAKNLYVDWKPHKTKLGLIQFSHLLQQAGVNWNDVHNMCSD